MEITQIKETLLTLLPHLNARIVKPVKQLLDENISLEMYYCLQTLRIGGAMTMTDFARQVQIPKHQMSKMSNRLFEQGFIERIYDENDRRIIRIKVTDKAVNYMNGFLAKNTDFLGYLLNAMTEQEKIEFGNSLETLLRIFSRISYEEAHEKDAKKSEPPDKWRL